MERPKDGAVPPVLHCVLGPIGKDTGDLRPAVAPLGLQIEQNGILLLRPPALLQRGVEVVAPALSALLSDAAGNSLGDFAPLSDACVDAVDNDLILLLCPRPLDETRLQDFLPPVQALHVRSLVAHKVLRDRPPVLGADYGHGESELLVLLLGPPAAPGVGGVLLRRRAPARAS